MIRGETRARDDLSKSLEREIIRERQLEGEIRARDDYSQRSAWEIRVRDYCERRLEQKVSIRGKSEGRWERGKVRASEGESEGR